MKKLSGWLYFRVFTLVGLVLLMGSTLRVMTVPGSFGIYICNQRPMTVAQVAAYRGLDTQTLTLLQTQRGLTVPDLCVIPQAKLERAITRAKNPNPDHPGEAVAFRRLQQQDESGQVPADGLVRASEQVKAMLAAQSLEPDVSATFGGISRGSWTWLGPGNIGGRVRAIVIHPTLPNTLWAASVAGGIWKTTDAGASWHILNDFMSNMAVSSLVIDPTNPNVLYAGTGEGFYNGDGLQGAGVFKTTDGGSTWNQLAATNTANWYYVNRLSISPNGKTILAATNSGIWRSTDVGASWTKVFASRTLDINFNPADGSKAIASGDADWGSGFAVYSTNGGVTWTSAALPSTVSRVEVAYAPSNPAIVYASADVGSGQVWKSSNGGASYVLVNSGNDFLGGQGWYDNALWVDPTNANILIVGGIDLWRSTDGGSTLTEISEWWNSPASAHADNHMIIQDPGFNGTTNKKVYFGNDGGVYRADNVYSVIGTTGWTELNNNLGITQFYGAAGNPASGNIIGGTQDNGTLFYTPANGAQNWTSPYGGDGGFSAADPLDSNYYYGEYVYLKLHRSSDGGGSSEEIYGEYWNGSAWTWKSAPYLIPDAYDGSANFIAPFVLDPNNSNRLLGGGLSLWRSNNVKAPNTNTTGPAWAAIKGPIDDPISAIAVAPGNSNNIWVGHNNGNVYKTTDGTATLPTWTQVDTNSIGLPDRYVTRITVDKNNNNRVYVTFGGFSANSVWVTTNGGSTWAPISSGLPALPVRSLVINPANSSWLYIGTELGIFTSENAGANWKVTQDGPTNTSVDELFWMNSSLVAATHGRGLFKTETLPCVSLTTIASPVGKGTVASQPAQNCMTGSGYSAYTPVTLRATPIAGYTFSGWTGSVTSSTNPLTVTLNASKSITANFIPIQQTISGNTVVAGVTLSYVNGIAKTTTSDASGNYSIQVPWGWTGTITPTKAGVSSFTPANRSLSLVKTNLTGQSFKPNFIITLMSIAAYDGYILESSETSNAGGTLNNSATTLFIGDNGQKKQYRSILAFVTGTSLPDNAVINKVTLKLRSQSIVGGGNPVTIFQGFMLDVKTGFFGSSALAVSDFQAAATQSVGPFLTAPASGWYTINLTAAKARINKLASLAGRTEIRLRFKLDDNNNAIANYLSLYSGNVVTSVRPQLIIEYTLP